jgi:cbb3-type cytochrome oxidase subunit 3
MSYETLAFAAKVFGPIWMMGFFIIVVIRAYHPKRKEAHERAARSILVEQTSEDRQ